MENNTPVRADVALVSRGLVPSRERAQGLIESGFVLLNGRTLSKSSVKITEADLLEIAGNDLPYVSRGGYKLEKAVKEFNLDLNGCVCMDIGASTGGFTDCMLINGAVKVYSIDVGYGQLAWKLRSDSRVVNMERTNFRYVTNEQIPEPLDFASIDVSFISLKIILSTCVKSF
jgi:23S rRNA (cytidine1920-2'-O)/16S rRNA (cytidine1409-2'-O)-methyltransferase